MPALPPRSPRVIFVNRFYRPDETATAQLLADLAESLVARGHTVAVIARHPGGLLPAEEILNGVQIWRVRSTRSTGGGLVRKACDFASFFCGATLCLLRTVRRGDAVVAMTDPPLLGIGVWLVARWRGARLFHWVQDIYPELAMELAGQRWLAVTRPVRDAAWRGAEKCVTLGDDMAAVLRRARVPRENISVQPNWAPAGLRSPGLPAGNNPFRQEWKLVDKFVIGYSGNFGRVHDLLPVLAVAEALRDEPEVFFVFIGDGAQRPALAARAVQRGLERVIFRPPQPRTRLHEALGLSDVHLITLRSGCERYVFPSKLYGIAAVARPVVFIGPTRSEIARIIVGEGLGSAFEPEDIVGIAAEMLRLKTIPAHWTEQSRAAAAFHARANGSVSAVAGWSALLSPPGKLAGSADRRDISPAA